MAPEVAAAMGGDKHTVEDIAIYSIGTASALTGVPGRRIRSWETEHNLLHPARTRGGHRLYSTRDVKLIREIRRLVVEEGLSLQQVKARLEAPQAESAPSLKISG